MMALHEVSHMSPEKVFASLPEDEQQFHRHVAELLEAPGVEMLQRMKTEFRGIMNQEEQKGHIEFYKKMMEGGEEDENEVPMRIEIAFDRKVVCKFQAKATELRAKASELTTELRKAAREGEPSLMQFLNFSDTLRQSAMLNTIDQMICNIDQKLQMNPRQRIRELYRKGFIAKVKVHKAKLAMFANTLMDAIWEFLPDLARKHGLDVNKVRQNVAHHDFQKMMQSAAFAGDVFDEDLASTYANFADETDEVLAMFFNAISLHNIVEGSREHGHHPHGVKALGNSQASEKVRLYLLAGAQDINKMIETMADTLEVSFSRRILCVGQSAEEAAKGNAWLDFAEREFFPGCNQEVPVEELILRYQILFTDSSLTTLEKCQATASYTAVDGTRQLLTTAMLKQKSQIFARLVALGEGM